MAPVVRHLHSAIVDFNVIRGMYEQCIQCRKQNAKLYFPFPHDRWMVHEMAVVGLRYFQCQPVPQRMDSHASTAARDVFRQAISVIETTTVQIHRTNVTVTQVI